LQKKLAIREKRLADARSGRIRLSGEGVSNLNTQIKYYKNELSKFKDRARSAPNDTVAEQKTTSAQKYNYKYIDTKTPSVIRYTKDISSIPSTAKGVVDIKTGRTIGQSERTNYIRQEGNVYKQIGGKFELVGKSKSENIFEAKKTIENKLKSGQRVTAADVIKSVSGGRTLSNKNIEQAKRTAERINEQTQAATSAQRVSQIQKTLLERWANSIKQREDKFALKDAAEKARAESRSSARKELEAIIARKLGVKNEKFYKFLKNRPDLIKWTENLFIGSKNFGGQ